jgi:hypothetical protein
MWNSPDGMRVLTAKEWSVFASGLDMLVGLLEEMIDAGDETEITATSAFESMSQEQKLCTLAQVAGALHDAEEPAPMQYAYNEAAVGAVFEMLKGAVQDEMICNDDKCLRTVIWDAIDQEVLEEMESKEMAAFTEEEWYRVIDGFEEANLWDADFDMEEMIVDLPPKQAATLKERLTIAPGYFTAIPPEPTREMLNQARSTLRRLLQGANT